MEGRLKRRRCADTVWPRCVGCDCLTVDGKMVVVSSSFDSSNTTTHYRSLRYSETLHNPNFTVHATMSLLDHELATEQYVHCTGTSLQIFAVYSMPSKKTGMTVPIPFPIHFPMGEGPYI
ncbi:Protein of unknown function [Pyronema omphalodes CBS 100304]|uniref:Uncharacterized protein n=1 Tax=Pyronema omphalodes (strain CBS 100304) TaxID=1076935 RepID=U4L1Y9_PYROM|nr:Protein of unknown function [Pyronema omphalodes CBS 100304]